MLAVWSGKVSFVRAPWWRRARAAAAAVLGMLLLSACNSGGGGGSHHHGSNADPPDTNNPPAATVATPASPEMGNVPVTFTLTDADGDACSVTVEYRGGSAGGTWTPATVSGATSGLVPGAANTITWRSGVDQPGKEGSDFQIRITPNDGHATGAAGVCGLFQVRNCWLFSCGHNLDSSPAVADDGTIYVGSSDGWFYAVKPDGTARWSRDTGVASRLSSPAIGADGTVFVYSADGHVWAMNPADGTDRPGFPANLGVPLHADSAPAIGPDGTVYFGDEQWRLHAIDPGSGAELAGFPVDLRATAGGGPVWCSPVVVAGIVFVGDANGYLHAIDPATADETAGFPVDLKVGSPVYGVFADEDGTVYAADQSCFLHAVNPANPAGEKAGFPYDIGADYFYAPGAVSPTRIIYAGSHLGRCFAINADDGTCKSGFAPAVAHRLDSSPAIGSDGRLRGLDFDAVAGKQSLRVQNPNTGAVEWSIVVPAGSSSPTIGQSGTVYIGTAEGLVSITTANSGAASANWPMFGRDSRHTGRIDAPPASAE